MKRVIVESDDEDDVPLIERKRKSVASSPAVSKKVKEVKEEKVEEEDVPLAQRNKSVKKAASKPKVKKEKKEAETKEEGQKEEEEEEEEYKWWLEGPKDSSVKWTTLEHNGPFFPPLYEPHGIKMLYKGQPVTLSPPSEEVATFFAGVVGTDWGNNPVFQKNFFTDWMAVLMENDPGCPIKKFEECDFTPIVNYLMDLKEKKKAMTKEEKLVLKEAKQKIDDEYGWCLLDGRKEKVGNFRIEPPGLFRGRGEHPKTGALKTRVTPEQVTINISEGKCPEPPAGHSWGKVICDPSVTWLAMWKENVNDSFKYVFLAANSSLKGQSDLKKFEKARELKKHVARIRKDYEKELKDEVMANRQRATALYFIDRLALRAGNEKGEDEADTVGCCSLRVEHITLEPPDKVVFDFLGKDSIRYYNEVQVIPQVFKNLKIFKREPKTDGDDLFDRLNTTILNKHLASYMEGLTAKVFRTYNASFTFQEELEKTPTEGTVAEKILAYNRANRQVAVLCNHQRAVPKTHGNQMNRLQDKILAVKYERGLVKKAMLEIDPKLKKTRPELAEEESDVDEEFIERHLKAVEEKERENQAKRLERENLKRKEAGEEPLTSLPKKKSTPLESLPIDKLEKKYEMLSQRIQAQKMTLIDKDENKTTALGTSKINYIDPRISAAWCAKHDVPLEKIFNRSLREKFKWAMDVKSDWRF